MKEIVGQKDLKSRIDTLRANFPRFSIIVGAAGQGKKLIASYISNGACLVILGHKAEDVQIMIEDSQRLSEPRYYVFAQADEMSNAAKNKLLKVTEEPPKHAYIIMTVEDLNNTLATLRSRAMVFNMEPYTLEQLVEYNYGGPNRVNIAKISSLDKTMLTLATNPGEVQQLKEIGIQDFIAFVQKVLDNVLDVTTSNALQISKSIRIKDEDEGYPMQLFWRMFMKVTFDRMYGEIQGLSLVELQSYFEMIKLTQQALNQSRNKSLNKKSLFDVWIMDVRKYCR